ncbi:MAG: PKD domain-containing protein, partial [Roseiflexaceae bacterium]
FQTNAWQPAVSQPETFAGLRDLTINVVDDTPVLSWSASTTISDTPQLYVGYVGTSAQRINTTVRDARHPRIVGGTTPQLIWLDYDTLNTVPLTDAFNNRSDTIVRQTDIFTGGLQLDELVANRLANGDMIGVLSGARGGQRDLSIIRYDQTTRTWGQPRPLSNDINIESSLAGAINESGNVFVGYRNDMMSLQSTIVEGQTITMPVKLGTGIVAMRANLTRDVALAIDTPVLQPNGTSVITATISNTGDTFEQLAALTVNGIPVTLNTANTLSPGDTRQIAIPVSQAQLKTGLTFAVGLVNGADDTPANNSVVLPAQIPALELQLQSLTPQIDGTFLANWRTTNLSNIDVPTTTVQVAITTTTVISDTLPPIPAGTSLDRTLVVPAQIQDATPAAQLFIQASTGISATQRLTLDVVPRIALELDANSLVVSDTGVLTVTVVNNGTVPAPANFAQIGVYTRADDRSDAIITSLKIPELLAHDAVQLSLPIPAYINPCGLYVRLEGLGINVSKNTLVVPQRAVPCADFIATPNPENRLEYTFYNQSTLDNPTDYLWSFGDGTTSTALQPVHAFTAPGTYTVQLQVSNATSTRQFSRALVITPVNQVQDGILDGQFTITPTTQWYSSTPQSLVGTWYGEDASGSAYARFESDVAATQTLSQTITLTQHNPYLVFDMFTNSSESVCGNDKIQIYFGTLLLGQRNVCTTNDRIGWNTYAIRIPKIQGTTAQIRIVGSFNSSIRSIIGIDNVTLITQPNNTIDFATQPNPVATPTNTRTPSITRTPTMTIGIPTHTRTTTPTTTPTATRSLTYTHTQTPTPTQTATSTRTATRTATSSRTNTYT